MRNLTPVQRPDKNGKLVTRHVRNGASIVSVQNLPAPTASAPKAPVKKKVAPKKPLEKQLKQQSRMGNREHISPDPAIYQALGLQPEQLFDLLIIQASDVEMYDMFAILSTDNAAVMMDASIKSPEKTKEILESNGLGHLLIDRKDLTDEAISRRIDAWNFLEAERKFGVNEMDCDPDVYLGAVRLDDSTSLPRWRTNGVEDSYAHHVMRGEISYDDVMALGIGLLSSHESMAPHICSYLEDIHTGKANYDVDTLGMLIQKSRFSNAVLEEGISMAGEYGNDFMMGIVSIDAALKIDRAYRSRPIEHRAELIKYNQEGSLDFRDLSPTDIGTLFDAGVPAEMATELIKTGMSVTQVVGAHQDGISKSVSSGYL